MRSEPFPYNNYAYQEFAAPHPSQGFEYVDAYKGSQAFYWEEIVSSREFKLMILRERGEDPQTKWGLLDNLAACPYEDLARVKKEGLYLRMALVPSEHPAEYFRNAITRDFVAISTAFVKAARVRGISIAPVGGIALFTNDVGSWKAILRRLWVQYLVLCCGTSVLVVILVRERA